MPLRRLERKGSRDESGLAWNWRFGGGDGCIGKGVGDLLSVWTGTFCSAILARHYHCLERLSKKRRYYYCGFYPFLLVRGEWVTVTGLTWRSSSLAGGVDSDKRYHDEDLGTKKDLSLEAGIISSSSFSFFPATRSLPQSTHNLPQRVYM
jgi:hypothetical protein